MLVVLYHHPICLASSVRQVISLILCFKHCSASCCPPLLLFVHLPQQLEEFKQWLQQQVDAQDKKDPTDEPAFIAIDVGTKWEGVQKALRKTDSKRKPKPPKPAANETVSANETAAEGAAEGAEAAGREAGAEKGQEAGSGDAAGAGQQDGGGSSSSSKAAEDEELPPHEEL
jgi:hypothetical protein